MDKLWLNIVAVAVSFDLMEIGITGNVRSGGRGKRRIVATVKSVWLRSAVAIAGWSIFAWAMADWIRKLAPALT